MGGWRGGAPSGSAALSPVRVRRSDTASGGGRARVSSQHFAARRDTKQWRDALAPVKESAAIGENGHEALRVAMALFFRNVEVKGIPTVEGLDKKEAASDLLLLVRAVNRFGPSSSGGGGDGIVRSNTGSSNENEETDETDELARQQKRTFVKGVDSLVSDLVNCDAISLDVEVVGVLAAYYGSRLQVPNEKETTGDREPAQKTHNHSLKTEAFKVVQILAQEGGRFLQSAEIEQLVFLALAELTHGFEPATDTGEVSGLTTGDNVRITKKHALGALGALVRNAGTGVLSKDAFHACGAALVGCFENENPKDGKQKIEHTASASRLFAAAWRCAHLCASGEAGAWPESVIAGLVGHAKRFLTYGVGASQGDQQEETENAPVSGDEINPPTSPSGRRGYVPPHLRHVGAGAAAGMSDSDTSDSGTATGRAGDRFGSSKVRANALSTIAALARVDPRSLHQHWLTLLPTSTGQLLPRSPSVTLAKVLLADPSPRVRAAAASAIAHLFDAPASRQFFSAADVALDKKTGLPVRRVGFASLSSTLGDVALATHHALCRAVTSEPEKNCLPSACKALAAFVDAAPFKKLPSSVLPETIRAAWRRFQVLTGKETNPHSHCVNHSTSDDTDTATASVALLSVLAASLGAKGAPAGFASSLAGAASSFRFAGSETAETATSEKHHEKPSTRDAVDLHGLLPRLAQIATDHSVGVAVRCEAFGALRHAGASHVGAVAANWRDSYIQKALPHAFFSLEHDDQKNDGADRTDHACARFLSEFLLAAGGGGAAASAAAAAASAADETSDAKNAQNARVPCNSLSDADLVQVWTEVAQSHLPAMTTHGNALVRAAGIGALGGITASALRGVREDHARLLRNAPRDAMSTDDSPAVRAAACRAVGALAALPTRGSRLGEGCVQSGNRENHAQKHETETEKTRQATARDASLLIAAMRDSSKSVRLPASWAVANLCGAVTDRAAIDSLTLSKLALACVDAAQREGDKVRANAARALGHVLALADFSETSDSSSETSENDSTQDLNASSSTSSTSAAAWLPDATQALMSCLTTGNAKTQWNACIAIRELFCNDSVCAATGQGWSPLVIRILLMLVRDSPNLKLKQHCAATLASPRNREAFGGAYADVVSVVVGAVELGFDDGANDGPAVSSFGAQVSSSSRYGSPGPKGVTRTNFGAQPDAGATDADARRGAPRFAARLAVTLLRVVSLGTEEDAESVRDALVKKRLVFKRVVETSRSALFREYALSKTDGDADFPEDPFGFGKKQETDFAVPHDDVAVGVSGGTASSHATAVDTSLTVGSMDVKTLAAALSPVKSPGRSATGGAFENDEGDDGYSFLEIAAAALGLSRMYRALGGKSNEQDAAFYETAAGGEAS